jgi:murein DD-endopeptidase MepM/ murein hydrolase activator NlpD
MKRSLKEELERIHGLTYKNLISEDDGFLDRLLSKIGVKDNKTDNEKEVKIDEPEKADLVSDNVKEFFDTLESIDEPIFQQSFGSMTYQKNVETVQIGLILLGYELPRHGVDGLFGPETGEAVDKFKLDNNIKESINESQILMAPVNIDRVTSPFGKKRSYETHPGVDIGVPSGTKIQSPADGKVIDAKFKKGACGGTIQVDHQNGFISRYCHAKRIDVNIGDSVKQGQVLGLTGGGSNDIGRGNSRGAHLHFELKKNGSLVNPLKYVDKDLGTYDFSKEDESTEKSVITAEMVNVMVDKLKARGVKPEDLSKHIDKVITTGGGDIFTDIDLNTSEGLKLYEDICDRFISTRENPLNITGKMLANGAASVYKIAYVPPELALGQLAAEGGVGHGVRIGQKPKDYTKSVPIETNNPYNIGNWDDGRKKYFSTQQDGINSYFKYIARDYLSKSNKTAADLIKNFVNYKEQRYASGIEYEELVRKIASQVNSMSQPLIAAYNKTRKSDVS